MSRYTILLADDHRLVRAGLKSVIDEFGDFEVIAEADDGREAVRLAIEHRPDIAVLDLTMPEMNGLEATAHIIRECPNTRVVILSMHATEQYVMEALTAGATGYVIKDCAVDELGRALDAMARGGSYLSPLISRQVVGSLTRAARGQRVGESGDGDQPKLTLRQREILQLIAGGYSTREIAERLVISYKTVETHRAHLMRRLNLFDTASLTRYAIRVGLIGAD